MTKRKNKDASNGEEYAAAYSGDYPYSVPQPPAYLAPAPPDMHSVSISVLSSHGATVAKAVYASVYNTGIPVTVTGSAKREPGDRHDPETGRLLATARAMEVLAIRLRRQATSRVRNAEAIKRHHEEVRKRDAVLVKQLRDPAVRPAALDSAVRGEKKEKKRGKL